MDAHSDFVKCLLIRHYIGPNPFTNEPNVTLMFSGSSDASIRVWNIETGACLSKLEGHRRAVESLALDYAGTAFPHSLRSHISYSY